MARTRYLKPGFFNNERLCEFGPWHRILFEGLWIIADREGRLEDRPKRIKAQVFPYDDGLDVNAMLQDLSRGPDPFVWRYIVKGVPYLAVCKFLEHQRPHPSEPASVIPEPPEWLTDPGNTEGNHGGADLAPHRKQTSQGETDGELRTEDGELRMGNEVPPSETALLPVAYTPDDLVGLWNALADVSPEFAKVKQLTSDRTKKARKRLTERPFEQWREVIAKIGASDFCRGLLPPRNGHRTPWIATFDWLLKPESAVKVLEGTYDNRTPVRARDAMQTHVDALKYAGVTEGDDE